MSNSPRKVPLGIRLIGIFKLISSVLLVGLGYGIFREIGTDPAIEAEHIVAALKLDPQNRIIHSLMETVSGVSRHQLFLVSAGTFVYAILYAIEGIGLVLHKRWGEYVTIFITGSLIPFEAYEVIRRITALRFFLLALNLAIVLYLIWQLRRGRALEKADEAAAGLVGPADQP